MKTQYISQLEESAQVLDYFLVSSASIRKTKRDKDYLSLILVDKTGEMDGRVWDIPAGLDPNTIVEKTFVKVRGSVSEYNDKLQMSITQIRPAEVGEFEFEDFFRRSERDPEEMYQELVELLTTQLAWESRTDPEDPDIDPTYKLLLHMLEQNKEKLLNAPAAMSVHHCFLGGLLEHVLSMAHLAVDVCEHYGLRKDLVLAACVLHDIGKTRELTYDMGIGYSSEGTLIGHIPIGMMMVSEACDSLKIDPRLKMEILHMVASHHGSLAWGSPKVPAFKEAIAFHLIDSMDSKMELCDEVKRNDKASGEFTAFSKYLDTFMYKGAPENG